MDELPLDAAGIRRFVAAGKRFGWSRDEVRSKLVVRPADRRTFSLTDIEIDRIIDEFDWPT